MLNKQQRNNDDQNISKLSRGNSNASEIPSFDEKDVSYQNSFLSQLQDWVKKIDPEIFDLKDLNNSLNIFKMSMIIILVIFYIFLIKLKFSK
jgi:hypothetical protein